MAANVQIVFTMSEADAHRLETALCSNAGLPVSAANAKAIQIAEWRETVEAYERRQAAIAAGIAVT